MATSERPARAASAARPISLTAIAVPLALFLAAFLPRLSALTRYVTPDEPVWVYRSIGFRQALLSADWANTLQSGHPGVITTWLGALAIQLKLFFDPAARADLDWLGALPWLRPENAEAVRHLSQFLTPARLVMAVATSLGVVAIWLLARRRLDPRSALLGGLMLALDPISVGLSGILHVDGLLATLMLIAFLLALPVSTDGRQATATPGQMALSGLVTGLAVLTKTPGLFLLAAIPLVHLWSSWRARSLKQSLQGLFAWGVALGLATLIFLPALWLGPGTVLAKVQALTGRLVESAARPNFFLGQMTLNPGPAYYPLVLIFRLSPAVSLGLLALLGLAIGRLAGRYSSRLPVSVVWLVTFGLGFALFLNVSATRHQRYLIPAIMPLILAAAGAAVALARRLYGDQNPGGTRFVMAGMALFQAGFLLAYIPYPLAAYNWLAGGPVVAQRVFRADWGESAGAAAKWAALLPGADGRTLFTANVPSTAPFFPGRVLRMTEAELGRLAADDLLVVSAPDAQQTAAAESAGDPLARLPDEALAGVVQIAAGLQARIYSGLEAEELGRSPIEVASRLASFDQAITLVSAGASPAAWPEPLVVLASWQAAHRANFTLRLALVDEQDHAWSSREMPLLDEADRPPASWLPGQEPEVLYTLPVPADLPPGAYAVQASLFNEQGARLGVFSATGRFEGVAATLARISSTPPAEQPAIQPPIPIEGGPPDLLGYDSLPPAAETGAHLTLDLWWRVGAQVETDPAPDGALLLSIGPASMARSLDTAGWQGGQVYHLRPTWQLPVDLPHGDQAVSLMFVDAAGDPLWPAPVSLGNLTVRAVERVFELPEGLRPLGVFLGSVARLQQATADVLGDEVILDVVWQADRPDNVAYTTFVHLINRAGAIVSQVDRPPAPPTDTWIDGQVVSESYRLPAPPPGAYTLALGLYDSTTGRRLPAQEAGGGRLAADQVTLELVVP